MFNNKFNSSKKDPLVEAVKQAQAEGDLRRQAEALVNEEFGVYSRKAVIREQLSAYDARLEEAYKCMKEGNRDNKEKKKEHEEKVGMEHIKKMGGFPGQSLKRTARSLTKEGNDGNLANNYPPYDKVTRGDVIAGALKKDQMGGKKKMGEGLDVVVGKNTVTQDRDPRATSYDKTLPQTYPGKASSAPTGAVIDRAKAPVTPIKEDEQLDEVSKRAAISAYREKEAQERDTSKLHGLIKRKFGAKTAHNAERAGAQSSVGLVRRGEDRGKEDSIARDRRHPRDRMTKSGKVHKQDTATLKGNIKRRLGSHTKPGHLPEETVNEAAYSAKAARAGKDIGKPGPGFANIAKKAGAKYGSKERGEKVAGAILKKIRAKHMKEDSSFNVALQELVPFNKMAARGVSKSITKAQDYSQNDEAPAPASSARPKVNAPLPPVKPSELKASVSSAPRTSTVPSTGGSTSTVGPTPVGGANIGPNAGRTTAPKPAASTPAATTSTDTYSGGRNKAAFDAAFDKAREKGGSTARFKFDGKDYQAAKTKDEYVSSSKQKEVDIGDLSKNTASATPADSTNTNASVTANRDSESNKKKQQDAGTTPQNVAESFVSVGANKYRIV